MKKNIVIAVSWCITVILLVVLWWVRDEYFNQDDQLRSLRADLWRQQVSMREKQVTIAKRIECVDETTRRVVMDLLIQSATEVDVLREQNNIWNGKDELAELKQALEQINPQQSPAGDVLKAAPEE